MTTRASEELAGWFAGRLPDQWFTGAPEVDVDAEEILVVGRLAEPTYPDGAGDDAKAAARSGRARQFREDTREARMDIAAEAEYRTKRKVAWGVQVGEDRFVFTNLNVPVMTRLRMQERAVLDTLISGGVARSRSEALAWCVRLVAEHQGEWLADLESALARVHEVREQGPQ
ncbi:MAG TPA: hypothetical protein VGH94_01830 [Acidimicrobiales bacterium]|jgi:hypothetical protein